MGQVLHGRAKTTYITRKEIQESKESISTLANRLGVSRNTVWKWKNRDFVHDLKCGRRKGQGTVLTREQEQIIVEIRSKGLHTLDDIYCMFKPMWPNLTRSNLYRCLKRHNLSRLSDILPRGEAKKGERGVFKDYEPGYLHMDTTEVRVEKKRFYVYAAVDRATRYAYVEVRKRKTMNTSTEVLRNVVERYPFKITTILTDNGIEFTYSLLPKGKRPPREHPFDEECKRMGIEHRLTKFRHPFTNGMVEAFNRRLKEKTTRKYHYDTVEELIKHLKLFLMDYNFRTRLRSLEYKTPFDKVVEWWTKREQIYHVNPYHLIVERDK